MAGYSDYLINMAVKVMSNAVPINDLNVISKRFVDSEEGFFKFQNYRVHESSASNIVADSINIGSSNQQLVSDISFELEVKKCIKKALSYLKSENYIEGEITKTQIYLEALHDKNKSLFLEVFQQLWLSVYYTPEYLRDYLCIAASMDYKLMKDRADVLILGCASHEDILVQEAAIRAFEAWENPEHALHLRSMRKFEEKWIEDYKQRTIEFLEGLK